jgi:hypothetical protein
MIGMAGLLGLGATLGAQTVPPELREFLAANGHFDESDFRDLTAGKPVARLLETKDRGEVAGVGAVRIAVPRDFFLAQLDDIVRYKQEQVSPPPEIGRFDSPPRLADLQALSLSRRDIESLRSCRPGDCAVKLPAAAIERFRKEIPWSGAEAHEAANRLFREFLLARLQGYLTSGGAALAPYADKNSRVSITAGFDDLLAAAPYLSRRAPRLADCLARFPHCDSSVKTFLYWSKEKFGHRLRPVISVSQVMVDREGNKTDDWVWEASKQLYASHYLDCSLSLSLLVDAREKSEAPAFYFVYLNRSRSDLLRGALGGLVQGLVQIGVGGKMNERLERLRKRMESLWKAHASQDKSRAGPHPAGPER